MALALDLALGDFSNRRHPVALLGKGAGRLDRLLTDAGKRDTVGRGAMLVVSLVGGAAAVGWLVGRACGAAQQFGLFPEAVVLKQALALRGLLLHGRAVRKALESGDLPGARTAVSLMVSRETSSLPEELVVSAAIESLAENLSDSVFAAAAYYLVAGLPGALAYRAANTLDAMVGYPNRGRFGLVPARLDDGLNLLPARVTAALIGVARPRALGHWRKVAADATKTASPNAGWPMAAMAYGLGVRLEKRGHHVLNEQGRPPGPGDIAAAERTLVLTALVGGLALATMLAHWGRR